VIVGGAVDPRDDDLDDEALLRDAVPEEPPRDVVAALLALADPGALHEAGLLGRMSHVAPSELDAWHTAWVELADEQRRTVVRAMIEGAEADVHLDFGSVFRLLLEDDDAEVRAVAVDGLWESTDPRLARRFTALLREDGHAEVRARAAEALGVFVELGELDRIDAELRDDALEALLDAARDPAESPEVRRRATASAGYAEDEAVRAVLSAGLESDELLLRLGAMRGIGNSADEAWEAAVLAGLADTNAEMRFEAVRAAGELELESAVIVLARLIVGDEAEIRHEAIWALGEIGSPTAQAVLEKVLRRPRSDEEREAIEDALSVGALHRLEILPVPRSMLGGAQPDEDEDAWMLDDDDEELVDDDAEGDALDDLDAQGDWRGAIEDAIDDDAR